MRAQVALVIAIFAVNLVKDSEGRAEQFYTRQKHHHPYSSELRQKTYHARPFQFPRIRLPDFSNLFQIGQRHKKPRPQYVRPQKYKKPVPVITYEEFAQSFGESGESEDSGYPQSEMPYGATPSQGTTYDSTEVSIQYGSPASTPPPPAYGAPNSEEVQKPLSNMYGPPKPEKKPNPPSNMYGPPKPEKIKPKPPSNMYGPPEPENMIPEPQNMYGPNEPENMTPKPPSNMYGPPQPPTNMYGPPNAEEMKPKPQSNMYGPPQPPTNMYKPPQPEKMTPKPPSNMYGPSQPQTNMYSPPKPEKIKPKPPSNMYGPSQPPANMYGDPQPEKMASKPPTNMYGPPQPPTNMHGPPQPPTNMYGPPQPEEMAPKPPTLMYGPPQTESMAQEPPSNMHSSPQAEVDLSSYSQSQQTAMNEETGSMTNAMYKPTDENTSSDNEFNYPPIDNKFQAEFPPFPNFDSFVTYNFGSGYMNKPEPSTPPTVSSTQSSYAIVSAPEQPQQPNYPALPQQQNVQQSYRPQPSKKPSYPDITSSSKPTQSNLNKPGPIQSTNANSYSKPVKNPQPLPMYRPKPTSQPSQKPSTQPPEQGYNFYGLNQEQSEEENEQSSYSNSQQQNMPLDMIQVFHFDESYRPPSSPPLPLDHESELPSEGQNLYEPMSNNQNNEENTYFQSSNQNNGAPSQNKPKPSVMPSRPQKLYHRYPPFYPEEESTTNNQYNAAQPIIGNMQDYIQSSTGESENSDQHGSLGANKRPSQQMNFQGYVANSPPSSSNSDYEMPQIEQLNPSMGYFKPPSEMVKPASNMKYPRPTSSKKPRPQQQKPNEGGYFRPPQPKPSQNSYAMPQQQQQKPVKKYPRPQNQPTPSKGVYPKPQRPQNPVKGYSKPRSPPPQRPNESSYHKPKPQMSMQEFYMPQEEEMTPEMMEYLPSNPVFMSPETINGYLDSPPDEVPQPIQMMYGRPPPAIPMPNDMYQNAENGNEFPPEMYEPHLPEIDNGSGYMQQQGSFSTPETVSESMGDHEASNGEQGSTFEQNLFGDDFNFPSFADLFADHSWGNKVKN